MPRIDLAAITASNATDYPAPFDAPMAGRFWQRLAPAGGLTLLGASRVVLKPGGWSSQRHWHADEDELVVILSGKAVLIEDAGETVVGAGDVLAFAMGARDGHHLVNRSAEDCVMIAVGAGNFAGSGEYPDIDMTFAGEAYLHKDGTAY